MQAALVGAATLCREVCAGGREPPEQGEAAACARVQRLVVVGPGRRA